MIARICIFGLLVLSNKVSTENVDELPVKDRINLLKFQMEQELKEKTQQDKAFLRHQETDAAILNANYDYVDLSKVAITPISDRDDRKKNEKFKLRQLATSPKSTTIWTRKSSWPQLMRDRADYDEFPSSTTPPQKLFNPLSDENIEKANTENKQTGKGNKEAQRTAEKEVSFGKPIEIFYKQRRLLQDEAMRDTPIQWTHCEDMITPFLTGMKGALNAPLILAPTHRTVLRLVHLLNTNITRFSKEEILSLMYQISNVQIRLFQWQESSLSLLLDVICKGKKHTYANIRHGLKALFGIWHLDYSNTTNLLDQSRLFRPACVNSISTGGSTQSSKITRYTRPKTTTKGCDDD